MFNKAFYVGFTLLACAPQDPGDVQISFDCRIHPTQQTEAKACLVECAQAANPKSDEESEDLVYQCEKSCTNIYCWRYVRYFDSQGWCDCRKGLTEPYRTACMNAGWKPELQ